MSDTVHIAMQIAEAEHHVADLRGPASKRGQGQSTAQLRLSAAEAILATLRWCAENQAAVREWQKGR